MIKQVNKIDNKGKISINSTSFTNFLISIIHDDKILNDFDSNTNITLLNSNKCKNCQNEKIIIIKLPYITFNEDDIEKEKGDIKKLFTNFNSNETNKKEYCEKCKNIADQVISPINVKYSKYIII